MVKDASRMNLCFLSLKIKTMVENRRILIPGSEWLYFKIYVGIKTSDDLIIGTISPFVSDFLDNEIISSYFFIRYIDKGYHIRLRLHLKDKSYFNYVLEMFSQKFGPLIEKGIISDVEIGTYRRELERYGFYTTELVEELFFYDSQIILAIIDYIHHNNSKEIVRVISAFCLIDYILNGFGYCLDDKVDLMSKLSKNFFSEFGFNSNKYTGVLNKKFREYRKDLEHSFDYAPDFFTDITTDYKMRTQSISEKIMENASKDKNINKNNLLGSIIHMSMNRLFQSNNRIYELIIYYFIEKIYKSKKALESIKST